MKNTWRYNPLTHVYHKSRSYDIWFLRYKVQRTKFFHHFGPFLPLDPPNNPKNQNFEIKKYLEILSFYTCVPQMMIKWCMVPETSTVTIFFHFGLYFALLPPNSPKNKKLKKLKKTSGDNMIFHKCTKNHYYLLYCSWDKARDGCNCCFSFWAIFCPFTSTTAQKIKISKIWKNTSTYHFTQLYQKLWL